MVHFRRYLPLNQPKRPFAHRLILCYSEASPLHGVFYPSSCPHLTLSLFFSPSGLVLGATRLRGLARLRPSEPYRLPPVRLLVPFHVAQRT